MPVDETTGSRTLTPAQLRRLRALRRRAASRRKEQPQPVRGENAREKARVPVQAAARETVEQVIAGKPAKEAAAKFARLKLTEPEKRDVERFSRVRSKTVQADAAGTMVRGTPGAAGKVLGVPVGLALFGNPDVVEGLRETRDMARSAVDVLKDPASSRREKLQAAGATVVIGAGGAAGPGRPSRSLRSGDAPKRPKTDPSSDTRDLSHLADYKPRTVRYRGQETQFPASQSRITRPVQRAADRVSETLAPAVDRLRESDSVLARTAGKALTLPSARRRVPIQAGKHVAKEGDRAKALRADDLRALDSLGKTRLPGRKLEGEQLANWWWTQVPPSHRTPETLNTVRGKLAEQHERLTRGEFGQSVRGAQQSLRAQARAAREAGDTQAVFKAVNEIKNLRRIEADIPERLRDLGENLAKLDKVIAKPPPVNERAIQAADALAADLREIYIAAGKLKPEVAAERDWLVSDWLGIDRATVPAGERPTYMGHRQGKVKGSRPSAMPGGVGLAKTKLPAGVARKNRLVLAKSGRVRQDMQVAAEDWQAGQAYKFTNQAKDTLGQMGEPIVGRPKPGYAVVNPRGHELPRTWKTDDEAQALAEGFDPDEIFTSDLEEYVRNVIAGPAEAAGMMKRAEAAGHLADLRQVPVDVVNRYYSQFLPAKIAVATPGIKEGSSALSKIGDVANDTLYLSLIYSNIGYIPSQVMANTGMAVAHQGAFFPANFARATQVLTTGPKQLRDLLRVEHGRGATISAAGTSPVRKISAPIAGVADDAFRMSAVLHEAARLNVIPKNKPVLSDADYAALTEFATDPRYRAALNDAGDRATQSMVDFNRLGAKEAAISKPAGFVWRWIRGGSRYPLRFAADHPIRTAAGAAAAYAGQDEIRDRIADDQPPWLEGAIKFGTTEVGEKTYPRLLPTRSFSPVSTPLESVGTLTGAKGARAFGEMLNPGAMGLLRTVLKQNPYGGKEDGYWDALKANAERLTPTVGFVKDINSPPDDPGMYPEDVTRAGRIKRQSRMFPFAVDPKVALAARQRIYGDVPPERMAYRKVFEQRQEVFVALRKAAPDVLENGRLPKALRDAYNKKAAVESVRAAVKRRSKAGLEYHRAAAEAELRLLEKWGALDKDEADDLVRLTRASDLKVVDVIRGKLQSAALEPLYLKKIRDVRKLLGLN